MTAAVALREVRLYGQLGRSFGRVHRLAVLTPAEAVQALCAVLPGFEKAFLGPQCRAEYHVFVGGNKGKPGAAGDAIGVDEIAEPVGAAEPIRIVPLIAGAKKNGGWFQIILGAVLIYFSGGIASAWYGLAEAGTVAAGAVSGLAASISAVGLSMVLGGVVQVLSPQRKASSNTAADNLPSYGFDAGAVNTTQQGLPVPLCFGRMVIGSAVISQGLATEELALAAPTGSMAPVTLPAEQPADPIQPPYQWAPD